MSESIAFQEKYWNDRWASGATGWHLKDSHCSLVENISSLVAPGSTIFIPLCGKTLDMKYLRDKGYKVVGCELSEMPVQEFFEELNCDPLVVHEKEFTLYKIDGIHIFQGNIFNLLREDIGKIDAVFDRAALVALPEETREKYVEQLLNITNSAPQILVTFEHERESGPPHSIPEDLVKKYYSKTFKIVKKGKKNAGDKIDEVTYILKK